MVFQQGVPLHIWGWADPGEPIDVSLASASKHAVTAPDHRWSVILPALPAGGPFTLTVRGKSTMHFKDVAIGEVWVASGQSNMTYALSGASTGAEAVTTAADPYLRFFTVPKRIAVTPQTDTLPASWEVSSPDTAKEFSAVAYFFARELRRRLGVPVGIILSAWPGTAGEEWTDPASLRTDPVLQPIVARWNSASTSDKTFAAKPRHFSLEFDDFQLIPANPDSPPSILSNFDDGSAHVSTGGAWAYSWSGAPAATFELASPGRDAKGFAARISGEQTGSDDSRWFVNLHADGSPADLSSYSGVRFWARGEGSFVFQTIQPTITDWDNYGTKLTPASSDWTEINIAFKDLKQQGWGVVHDLTLNQITGFSFSALTDLQDPPRPPSGLYDGMITPLVNYPIRGAIWYQGESNTGRAFQYRSLLPAMIHGWRSAWKETDMPFLIVQLPNQGHSPDFAPSWWAELREAQLLTQKSVPDTGLAVTIDVGEAGNLHPPRKEEIGQRLALWALGTTYAQKLVYSGPLYANMRLEGNRIRINFTHAGTGLASRGEPPIGFTIAGDDRKFHYATAEIEGDSILVSSPDVRAPVAVRYAWADSPDCNLYNREGLPASPFRTDTWPAATYSER